MAIKLNEKFTIDLESDGAIVESISGTLTPLSRSQKKEAKLSARQNGKDYETITSKIKDNERLYAEIQKKQDTETDEVLKELYDRYDLEEAEIAEMQEEYVDRDIIESLSKTEFDSTVSGANMERLNQLCDKYGYKTILDEIKKVVVEGKSIETNPSSSGLDSSEAEQTTPAAMNEIPNSLAQAQAQQ